MLLPTLRCYSPGHYFTCMLDGPSGMLVPNLQLPQAITKFLSLQYDGGLNVQEAHALCPEGADLRETYHKPAHVPGATAGTTHIMPTPAGTYPSHAKYNVSEARHRYYRARHVMVAVICSRAQRQRIFRLCRNVGLDVLMSCAMRRQSASAERGAGWVPAGHVL